MRCTTRMLSSRVRAIGATLCVTVAVVALLPAGAASADGTPPAFTSPSGATALETQPMSFTITTTGSPTPAISTASALPAGLTLVDNGDGTATLSGTPACDTAGSYAIDLTADNGDGLPAQQTLDLTVLSPRGPVFTSPAALTIRDAHAFSFTVTTCSPSVPVIKQVGLTIAMGIRFVDDRNGTATIFGTPGMNDSGPYSVTISATIPGLPPPSDSLGPITTVQNFTLTVLHLPVFRSARAYNDTTDTPFRFNVTTALGYPVPTITARGLPPGVTLVDSGNGTGVLDTPGAMPRSGQYRFTITADNSAGISGFAPVNQLFTLRIYQSPVITSGASIVIRPGVRMTPFKITVEGYPVPAIRVTGLPVGIRAVNNYNGSATVSGTPSPTASGLYPVNIVASSVLGSTTQNFGVQIDGKMHGTVAIAPTPDGQGYWLVNNDGDVTSGGDAKFWGSLAGHGFSDVVNAVGTADGGGYWMVEANGGVIAFGDAKYLGSLATAGVDDVAQLVPTSDNNGYWLLEANGTVTPFGDATPEGSVPGVTDAVSMAATSDDLGYWVLEADGHITTFGDAPFHLSQTAVTDDIGIAATSDNGGYWIAEADGAVTTFGDATFHGAPSGVTDIVALAATPDGGGYWLVGTNGDVYNFGDAPFYVNQ